MSTSKIDDNTLNLQRFSGEWETKRLEELGEISGAGVDKKINSNEIPVRLVNYLDVYNKAFLYSKDLTHEVSARSDQVQRCVVEKGDVFFTPSSEVPDDIGCSAVAMEDVPDGVYSYHVVRLRLETDWDLYFRAYIFNTNEFLNQASRQCDGSGTRYVISLPKFRAMTVRFPPTVEEQRAIAEALSDVDGLLNALEALIAKKHAIKQATMQQLLTGKTRLPGFSGVWETKQLGDIAQIKKGSMITEKDVVLGTIPVIAGGQKPAYYHNTANRSGKTITVSASGAYAGFVALYNQPIFASDCSTISESSRYSIDFVYYYLVFNQNVIYNAQTGGAQPHCYPTDLMRMLIDLPAIDEQCAIAAVLSDMDGEIAGLEQRRDKTRAIKQGMMQQLLTGRVRLVKPK